jgi:hypothetical protein
MAADTQAPPEPRLLDRLHRVTVEAYHRMAEAGVFGAEARVELLEGALVDKMTKNPAHSLTTGLIQDTLARLAPPGWYMLAQEPITLEDSEPEPDVALIRGRRRDHAHHHPGPPEVERVIEVSDASYRFDRDVKGRIYAAAGIAASWIVDLSRRRLEAFTEPTLLGEQATYATMTAYDADETITLMVDGREAARLLVRDILP